MKILMLLFFFVLTSFAYCETLSVPLIVRLDSEDVASQWRVVFDGEKHFKDLDDCNLSFPIQKILESKTDTAKLTELISDAKDLKNAQRFLHAIKSESKDVFVYAVINVGEKNIVFFDSEKSRLRSENLYFVFDKNAKWEAGVSDDFLKMSAIGMKDLRVDNFSGELPSLAKDNVVLTLKKGADMEVDESLIAFKKSQKFFYDKDYDGFKTTLSPNRLEGFEKLYSHLTYAELAEFFDEYLKSTKKFVAIVELGCCDLIFFQRLNPQGEEIEFDYVGIVKIGDSHFVANCVEQNPTLGLFLKNDLLSGSSFSENVIARFK